MIFTIKNLFWRVLPLLVILSLLWVCGVYVWYDRLFTTHLTSEIRKLHANQTHNPELLALRFSFGIPSRTVSLSSDDFKIPVLTYHHIDTVPPDQVKDPIAIGLRVSPKIFDEQMNLLKSKGYTTLNLDDYWKVISRQIDKPAKPILLTFDDGFIDNYTNAFPILKKYGFKGNFAVITAVVGQGEYASWDQLQQMKQAGMGFMSHTTLHCELAKKKIENGAVTYLPNQPQTELKPCPKFTYSGTLSIGEVEYEISQSKRVLEEKLGIDIFGFVYPYGSYNTETIKLLQKHGYKLAFTTRSTIPTNSPNPQFEIPRLANPGQQDGPLRGFFGGL
jgi:peptidoglycan/xylan/chitin deacetylase (PgdA/CDA1 family)